MYRITTNTNFRRKLVKLKHKLRFKKKKKKPPNTNVNPDVQLAEEYTSWLNTSLIDRKFHCYSSKDFNIPPETIGVGGSASVYAAKWKNTSTIYAIKKFVDNKEIYLTNMANSHENIIQFRGITKSEDETKYSLVLEYADGGTLRDYLRNSATTLLEWRQQLKFAKEIASAFLWLHDDKRIVHSDLHPNNILIHKGTIKISDFGRSFEKGKDYNTELMGVTPYVDPKCLNDKNYKRNEKYDIYSLGMLFWELTSCSSPFGHETKSNDSVSLILCIINGERESPIKNTNARFVELYQRCWQHEPDDRPDIHTVISELNCIDPEFDNIFTVSYSKKEISEKIEIEESDLSNCNKDCDLSNYELN